MTPEEYDAWYQTRRGKWMGELEYQLLRTLVAPAAGESLIDVGCGTGYFTRRFALDGNAVTGVDPDPCMLEVARAHRAGGERYLRGDARALPFKDGEFDYCISVTALCFIPDETTALAEMFRVTRRRLAVGLLNRRSILYLQKGRRGGTGAYRGAHWHTGNEVPSCSRACGVNRLSSHLLCSFPPAASWPVLRNVCCPIGFPSARSSPRARTFSRTAFQACTRNISGLAIAGGSAMPAQRLPVSAAHPGYRLRHPFQSRLPGAPVGS